MSRVESAVPENPKEALRMYILELERDYYPWYNRSSNRLKWGWGLGQGTALIAGVTASVLAAAASDQSLKTFGLVRTALVLLPIVGALASSLLAQTRARDLLALREHGREVMQALISRARADYAAAADDSVRLASLHTALVKEVSQLERDQSAGFLSIAPGSGLSAAKPSPLNNEASNEERGV